MNKRIPFILFVLIFSVTACGATPPPTEPPTAIPPTAQPIPTVDPEQVILLFTDPLRIAENLTTILKDWGLPNPIVTVTDNRVSVTYTQPPALLPSEYREIYLLVFSAAERAAPLSSTITLNILIENVPLFSLQANTTDVAALRRAEITTNDFLDRLVIITPDE